MKNIKVIIIWVCIAATLFLITRCERCSQVFHSYGSAITGLDRTVTLYDYQGDTVQTWEGDLNVVSDKGTQEIYFDINGKRTVIYGGIVVVQEK